MNKDLQKPQVPRRKCPWGAYPWICRGLLQNLYAQKVGADRVKNRLIWIRNNGVWKIEKAAVKNG